VVEVSSQTVAPVFRSPCRCSSTNLAEGRLRPLVIFCVIDAAVFQESDAKKALQVLAGRNLWYRYPPRQPSLSMRELREWKAHNFFCHDYVRFASVHESFAILESPMMHLAGPPSAGVQAREAAKLACNMLNLAQAAPGSRPWLPCGRHISARPQRPRSRCHAVRPRPRTQQASGRQQRGSAPPGPF
jgi:hypothetical protein